MIITLDLLLERRLQLQQDFNSTQSTLQAISGALQDLDYWVALVKKEEEVDLPSPPPAHDNQSQEKFDWGWAEEEGYP